jgi:hypothetical protein
MPRMTQAEYDAYQLRQGTLPVVKPSESEAERELHEMFERWLRLREIPFVHSRMDKRTTIAVGWPDFTALHRGKGLCVEFKADGGTLSDLQKVRLLGLERAGVPYLVTTDAGEAIRWTVERLGL